MRTILWALWLALMGCATGETGIVTMPMAMLMSGAVIALGLGALTRGAQQRIGDCLTALGILLALAVLLAGCTGTGSPCGDDLGCPTGWVCLHGRCER